MKINSLHRLFLIPLFVFTCLNIHAQPVTSTGDDSQVAEKYVQWVQQAVYQWNAQQAIDEQQWEKAYAAIIRAMDFADSSSDIPYLLAIIQTHYKDSIRQKTVIESLDMAIDINKWDKYSEYDALLLKAKMLISICKYHDALICLDQIDAIGSHAENVASAVMLRLLALSGVISGKEQGYDSNAIAYATAQFRSQVLLAMDRFPRDPRPLRIFFEYARNRKPQPSELPEGDLNLLELALRRLPFLLEADPELAWIAAPFMRNIDDAKRSVASYRSGSLSKDEKFKPNPASIPVALNLGLIDDKLATEEIFSVDTEKDPVIKKELIIDTYKLLRSEEGRDSFTRKLLTFSGSIIVDNDNDDYIETIVHYRTGFINYLVIVDDVTVNFGLDNDPEKISFLGFYPPYNFTNYFSLQRVNLQWERYPYVKQVELDKEIFKFGPAVFSYAPINFIELGGSDTLSGLLYPELKNQSVDLTTHTFLSFCSSYTRPSVEINGTIETLYMDSGVIYRAVETLNGQQVSVTEFEKGLPVIQHIDLDLDGRMETIRRFNRPPANFNMQWDILDYRRLIVSSESDWAGDGLYKTKEVYLSDGSVVYYFDMDGDGEMDYSETGSKK